MSEYNRGQGHLAQLLVDDLLHKIHQYDESLYLATVLGCLEVVKLQLIQEHKDEEEE